jgi:hypothetical protein
VDKAEDGELLCAARAFQAMRGRAEAADELKELLRNGKTRERRMAAHYLGLARVQSAVPVFASVSDQPEVPWKLRALCAGMAVRRGLGQGVAWFAKNAEQRHLQERARVAEQYGRAVEDIVPLMLGCKAVNIGRFV